MGLDTNSQGHTALACTDSSTSTLCLLLGTWAMPMARVASTPFPLPPTFKPLPPHILNRCC